MDGYRVTCVIEHATYATFNLNDAWILKNVFKRNKKDLSQGDILSTSFLHVKKVINELPNIHGVYAKRYAVLQDILRDIDNFEFGKIHYIVI